ncbi:MAG: T9SS type A sorting domain-containing protein [bacterium]
MSVLSLFLTVAWTIEIVATTKLTYPPTIALDSNNNPYLLVSKYRGTSGANDLYYLFLYAKVNGNWIVDTFETNCLESIHPPDLAIDINNRVWCIYRIVDTSNPGMYLIVARKDSTGWIKDTVEFSPYLDFYTYSITTDLDVPYITYDFEYENVACYAVMSNGVWKKTMFDTLPSWGNYSGFSIVFRQRPYISYMRFFLDGSGELWFAKKVDNIWVKEKLDNVFADFLCSFSSIAIGPSDFPNIAYLQQHFLGENPIVQYTYYEGALWHIDTVETLSWFNSPKALDVNSFSTPYLLYRYLGASDRKDRIAYKDSFGWHKEILPFTPETNWSWGGSLRVDHNGLVHIGRYATDYNDSIHETHYIWGLPAAIEEESRNTKLQSHESSKLIVYPNPSKQMFNIIMQDAEITNQVQNISLKIYNVTGELVKQYYSVIGSRVAWQGTDENGKPLSNGIYFVLLEHGSKRLTEKLVLLR